jgi:Flp pilus assembly protein TadG
MRRRDRGSQMVEFAIILPVLALLVFGIIQYGWIFFKASQLNQAARMGSRIAVRPAATEDEVRDAITAVMDGARLGSTGYTVSISDLTVDVGQPVEIQIDVNYKDNDKIDLLAMPLLPRPETLHGRAVMAKEGP